MRTLKCTKPVSSVTVDMEKKLLYSVSKGSTRRSKFDIHIHWSKFSF